MIDFTSYYYQFALAPAIRPFYRAIINGDVYEVRVMPQGAAFSCGIAQIVTTCIAKHHFSRQPFLVYIDNIYVSNDGSHPQTPSILTTPFHVGFQQVVTSGVILGVHFNITAKTVDVSPALRNAILSSEHLTVRDYFSLFGTVNFVSRVLHQGMYNNITSMKFFARLCTSFMLGEVDLESRLKSPPHLAKLQRDTRWWPPRKIDITSPPGDKFLFTDASNTGGAFVFVENGVSHIGCWTWPAPFRHTSINYREMHAILSGVKFFRGHDRNTPVCIVTDSLVSACALKKGYSGTPALNALVGEILSYPRLWIAWIEGQSNPADAPSRGLEVSFCPQITPPSQDIQITPPMFLWYSAQLS